MDVFLFDLDIVAHRIRFGERRKLASSQKLVKKMTLHRLAQNIEQYCRPSLASVCYTAAMEVNILSAFVSHSIGTQVDASLEVLAARLDRLLIGLGELP